MCPSSPSPNPPIRSCWYVNLLRLPVSQTLSYIVCTGIGLFFSAFMLCLTAIQARYTGFSPKNSEEFNSASRSVKPGLIASGIVSAWTWAATLVSRRHCPLVGARVLIRSDLVAAIECSRIQIRYFGAVVVWCRRDRPGLALRPGASFTVFSPLLQFTHLVDSLQRS